MPKGLLIAFGALAALVALGLAILPGMTATAWVGQSLPQPLAGVWLAWLFTLWGALVCAMMLIGAWVAEALAASEYEQPRTVRSAAQDLSQSVAVRWRPEPSATRTPAA